VERSIWDDVAVCIAPAEPRRDEMSATSDYVKRVRFVQEAKSVRQSEPHSRRPFSVQDEAAAAESWYRPHSFPALVDPAVDHAWFEPADHPVWPRAWKQFPSEWTDLTRDEDRRAMIDDLLRSAIADLPSARREVLERRDIHGSSAEDVSRELGISADDQTVMLHRARAAVQRALEPHFARVQR
jgi:hypothetical protein